jgi:hypothetical protein
MVASEVQALITQWELRTNALESEKSLLSIALFRRATGMSVYAAETGLYSCLPVCP